jgi:hypothetical protein
MTLQSLLAHPGEAISSLYTLLEDELQAHEKRWLLPGSGESQAASCRERSDFDSHPIPDGNESTDRRRHLKASYLRLVASC